MIELAALAVAAALGCALMWRFAACLREIEPRWAAMLVIFGAGAPIGLGLTSCLFFLCRLAAPGLPRVSMLFEAAAAGWLIFDIRRRAFAPAHRASSPAPALWLVGALLLGLAIGTAAMAAAWESNPQGGWDAWAIWNLRAKFLAAGQTPARAWSPLLTGTHPEYPLLLSGAVARAWAWGGAGFLAPASASYLFFLAMAAMVTGAVAIRTSPTAGLLAGIVLSTAPAVLREVPSQYSDIPLACYMAGAMGLALLDRPRLAGLAAGLAAWTKDEGILFLVVFLALTAILRRGQIVRAATGAAPGALLTGVFKLALAPPTPIGTVAAVFSPARIATVASGFGQELISTWILPAAALAALALGLGFRRDRSRDLILAGAAPLAMLAGYFAIFLLRSQDLAWQLGTALSRLFVQVSPLVVIVFFDALRPPESLAEAPPVGKQKAGKKGRT